MRLVKIKIKLLSRQVEQLLKPHSQSHSQQPQIQWATVGSVNLLTVVLTLPKMLLKGWRSSPSTSKYIWSWRGFDTQSPLHSFVPIIPQQNPGSNGQDSPCPVCAEIWFSHTLLSSWGVAIWYWMSSAVHRTKPWFSPFPFVKPKVCPDFQLHKNIVLSSFPTTKKQLSLSMWSLHRKFQRLFQL